MVKKVIKKHVREEIGSKNSRETYRDDHSSKTSRPEDKHSYKQPQTTKDEGESRKVDSKHSSTFRCKKDSNNKVDGTNKHNNQSKSSLMTNRDRSMSYSDSSKTNVGKIDRAEKDTHLSQGMATSCNNDSVEKKVVSSSDKNDKTFTVVIDLETEDENFSSTSKSPPNKDIGEFEINTTNTSQLLEKIQEPKESAKAKKEKELDQDVNQELQDDVSNGIEQDTSKSKGSRYRDPRSITEQSNNLPETSEENIVEDTKIPCNTEVTITKSSESCGARETANHPNAKTESGEYMDNVNNDSENENISNELSNSPQLVQNHSEANKLDENVAVTSAIDIMQASHNTIEKNNSEIEIECSSTENFAETNKQSVKVGNKVHEELAVTNDQEEENVMSCEILDESPTSECCETREEKHEREESKAGGKVNGKKEARQKRRNKEKLVATEIENVVSEVLSNITKEAAENSQNTLSKEIISSVENVMVGCNKSLQDEKMINRCVSLEIENNEISADEFQNQEDEKQNCLEEEEKCETHVRTDQVNKVSSGNYFPAEQNLVKMFTTKNSQDMESTPTSNKAQKRKCTPEIEYVKSIRELQNVGDENNNKEKIKTELIEKIKKHKKKYRRMVVKGESVYRVRRSYSQLEKERSLDAELGVDEEFNKKYYRNRYRSPYEEYDFYGEHCSSSMYECRNSMKNTTFTTPVERNTQVKITIKSGNPCREDRRPFEATHVRRNNSRNCYERPSSETWSHKNTHQFEDVSAHRFREKTIPIYPKKLRRDIVPHTCRHADVMHMNKTRLGCNQNSINSCNEITIHNKIPHCNTVSECCSTPNEKCSQYCNCQCCVAMLPQQHRHCHHPIFNNDPKPIQDKALDPIGSEQNSNEKVGLDNKVNNSTLLAQCEPESLEKILMAAMKTLLKKKYVIKKMKKRHLNISSIRRHSSRKGRVLKRTRKIPRAAENFNSNDETNAGGVDEPKNASPDRPHENQNDKSSNSNEAPNQFTVDNGNQENEIDRIERTNSLHPFKPSILIKIPHLNVSEEILKQNKIKSVETKEMYIEQRSNTNPKSLTYATQTISRNPDLENKKSTPRNSKELKISIDLGSIGSEVFGMIKKTETDKARTKQESSRDPRLQPRGHANNVTSANTEEHKKVCTPKPSPQKKIPKTSELINDLKYLKRKSSSFRETVSKKAHISKKQTASRKRTTVPKNKLPSYCHHIKNDKKFNESFKKSAQSFKIKNDILDAKFNESFKKNRLGTNSNINYCSPQKINVDPRLNPEEALVPIIRRRLSADTNGKTMTGNLVPRRHSTYADWKADQLSKDSNEVLKENSSHKEVKNVTITPDILIESHRSSTITLNNHETGIHDSTETVFKSHNKNLSIEDVNSTDVNGNNSPISPENNDRSDIKDEIITNKCKWGPQNFIKLGQNVDKPKVCNITASKISKGKRRVSRVTSNPSDVQSTTKSKSNLTLEEYLQKKKLSESSQPSLNKNKNAEIKTPEPTFVECIKVEYDHPKKPHGELSYSSIQDFILKQSSQNMPVVLNNVSHVKKSMVSQTNSSGHKIQVSYNTKKGNVQNVNSKSTNSHSTQNIKDKISNKLSLVNTTKESKPDHSFKERTLPKLSLEDRKKLTKSSHQTSTNLCASNKKEETINNRFHRINPSNQIMLPKNDMTIMERKIISTHLQKQNGRVPLLPKIEAVLPNRTIPASTPVKIEAILPNKTITAPSKVKVNDPLLSNKTLPGPSKIKIDPTLPNKTIPAPSRVKIDPMFPNKTISTPSKIKVDPTLPNKTIPAPSKVKIDDPTLSNKTIFAPKIKIDPILTNKTIPAPYKVKKDAILSNKTKLAFQLKDKTKLKNKNLHERHKSMSKTVTKSDDFQPRKLNTAIDSVNSKQKFPSTTALSVDNKSFIDYKNPFNLVKKRVSEIENNECTLTKDHPQELPYSLAPVIPTSEQNSIPPTTINFSINSEAEKELFSTNISSDILPKEEPQDTNTMDSNDLARKENTSPNPSMSLTTSHESPRNEPKIPDIHNCNVTVKSLPILELNDPSLEANITVATSAIETTVLTEAQLIYEKQKQEELANCPTLTSALNSPKPSTILRILTPKEIDQRFTCTNDALTTIDAPSTRDNTTYEGSNGSSNVDKIIAHVVSLAYPEVYPNLPTIDSHCDQVFGNAPSINTSVNHQPAISGDNPNLTSRLSYDTNITPEKATKSNKKTTAKKPQKKSKNSDPITWNQLGRQNDTSSENNNYLKSYAQYVKDWESHMETEYVQWRSKRHTAGSTSQNNKKVAPISIASRHSTESQHNLPTAGANMGLPNQNSASLIKSLALAPGTYSENSNFTTPQPTSQEPSPQFNLSYEAYGAKAVQNYRRNSYPQMNPNYQRPQNYNQIPPSLNASYLNASTGAPVNNGPLSYNDSAQTSASYFQIRNTATNHNNFQVSSSINPSQQNVHTQSLHYNAGVPTFQIDLPTQYVNTMYQNNYEGATSQAMPRYQSLRPGVCHNNIQLPNTNNFYQNTNFGGHPITSPVFTSPINEYQQNTNTMVQKSAEISHHPTTNGGTHFNNHQVASSVPNTLSYQPNPTRAHYNPLSHSQNNPQQHKGIMFQSSQVPISQNSPSHGHLNIGALQNNMPMISTPRVNLPQQGAYNQNILNNILTQTLLSSLTEPSQNQNSLNGVTSQHSGTSLTTPSIQKGKVIAKKRPRTKTTPVRASTPNIVQDDQTTNVSPSLVPQARKSLGKDAWVLQYLESRKKEEQTTQTVSDASSNATINTQSTAEQPPSGTASQTNTQFSNITFTSQQINSSTSPSTRQPIDANTDLENVISACLIETSPSSGVKPRSDKQVTEKHQDYAEINRRMPSVEDIVKNVDLEIVHEKIRKMSSNEGNSKLSPSCSTNISDIIQTFVEKTLRDGNTWDVNNYCVYNSGTNNIRTQTVGEQSTSNNSSQDDCLVNQDIGANLYTSNNKEVVKSKPEQHLSSNGTLLETRAISSLYDCRVQLSPLPLNKIIEPRAGNNVDRTNKTKSKKPDTVKNTKLNCTKNTDSNVVTSEKTNGGEISNTMTDTIPIEIKTETFIDLDEETQHNDRILEARKKFPSSTVQSEIIKEQPPLVSSTKRREDLVPPPLISPSKHFAPPLTSPPLLFPETQGTKAIVPPKKTTKNSFYNMYNPCFLLLNDLRSCRNLAERDENTLNRAVTSIASIVNEMFVLKIEQNLDFESPNFKKMVKKLAQASKVSLILILSYYQDDVYKVLHESIENSGGYMIGEYLDVKRTLLELVWSARNIELESAQQGELGQLMARYNKLATAGK